MTSLSMLSQKYENKWYGTNNVAFTLRDYSIKFNFRNKANLVVSFDHMQFPRPDSKKHQGWGFEFLRKNNVSALQIIPNQNCWYRKQELQGFFKDASKFGLFAQFENVMTYGGSMGGFAAMSFAGICDANRCLALNPQVHLGPSVRSWETRFVLALRQNWSDEFCSITEQLKDVETVVIAYDPYYLLDRKQIELLNGLVFHHIKVPFVGHSIPYHLIKMKMAQPLFTDTLSGVVDPASFNSLKRSRRKLVAYKENITERLMERNLDKIKINRILKNCSNWK